MKKIILVIASEGYQPHEYGATKKVLEESGFEVITASDKAGVVDNNIVLSELDVNNYDGLFFIGGPGALGHLDNEISYNLLRKYQEVGKPYGAICISPRILAKAGVLENKKATGWDGDDKLSEVFEKFSVEYVRENIVVDNNIVTANGPEAAEGFGKAIVEVLK